MRKEVEKTIHQNVTGSQFFFAHLKPPNPNNNIRSCGHLIMNATVLILSLLYLSPQFVLRYNSRNKFRIRRYDFILNMSKFIDCDDELKEFFLTEANWLACQIYCLFDNDIKYTSCNCGGAKETKISSRVQSATAQNDIKENDSSTCTRSS